MDWKDEIRRGDTIASTVILGRFKLSVHHYVSCGNVWFTSCYGLFDKYELGEDISLEQAKAMAIVKLRSILTEAINALERKD